MEKRRKFTLFDDEKFNNDFNNSKKQTEKRWESNKNNNESGSIKDQIEIQKNVTKLNKQNTLNAFKEQENKNPIIVLTDKKENNLQNPKFQKKFISLATYISETINQKLINLSNDNNISKFMVLRAIVEDYFNNFSNTEKEVERTNIIFDKYKKTIMRKK